MIRSKFRYTGYEATLHTSYPHRRGDGSLDYERPELVEMRTMKLGPVSPTKDPADENSRFWNATPTGSIFLGAVNPEAWKEFEIGSEYYVDFSPAPKATT